MLQLDTILIEVKARATASLMHKLRLPLVVRDAGTPGSVILR